jgi:hypothetical protein
LDEENRQRQLAMMPNYGQAPKDETHNRNDLFLLISAIPLVLDHN